MKESMAKAIESLVKQRFSQDVNKMFYVQLQKNDDGEIISTNQFCDKHNKPKDHSI